MSAGIGPQSDLPEELESALEAIRRRLDEPRPDGELSSTDAVLQDLATAHEELRVADEEIRVQQAQLASLRQEHEQSMLLHERVVSALPVAVVATDEHGQVQMANPAAEALLGVSEGRLAGKPLFAFVALEHRTHLRDALREVLVEGGSVQRDAEIQGRARARVPVHVYAARQHSSERTSVTWVIAERQSAVRGAEGLPGALVALTRLAAVADAAPDFLPRAAEICQAALGDTVSVSLMLGDPIGPDQIASTSTLAQTVDGAQVMAGEGPCAASISRRGTVVSTDLRLDDRWPRLRRHVLSLNVRGVVATPIVLDHEVVGALNAFGTSEEPRDEQFVRACELLALALGNTLQELRIREELTATANEMRQALVSRAVIDQAKGIVMADKGCTADEAFQHLVDLSSRSHVKVRDIAAALVARASNGRGGQQRPGPR